MKQFHYPGILEAYEYYQIDEAFAIILEYLAMNGWI
jgi:hypothetical protein